MDFADQITQMADRISKMKHQLLTEEATKNALIMPFIQALGYDVFNPMEVIPEFTSDIGTKKGEKVDYAIMQGDKMVMLIECKGINDNLSNHDSQLIRYFHTCEAKFAILTNGQVYKFYTDIEDQNKLDDTPFFEIDLLNIKEQQVAELKKFHKSNFDIDKIISTASELKYTNAIKTLLSVESETPSETFVRFFISHVYNGKATARVIEQFTEIVKKAINQWMSDKVSSRLKSALEKESESDKEEAKKITDALNNDNPKKEIETTQEEIEGFLVVKSIIRQKSEPAKILYRDNQNYFSVFYDKQTQPLCRLHFNKSQKYIGLINEEKKEDKFAINNLDEIYNYSEHLLNTLSNYINN